jgi:aryl-alcohol dehydrogenase-like predicted oxidoreductase
MEYRTLGKNGPRVSLLGLGTWPIGGGMGHVDEQEAVKVIRTAVDLGVTMIDTAEGYRTSEEILGRALQDGYRARCFLATKATFDFSPEGIRKALENSLRMLQTDRIDLYQLHNWSEEQPVEASLEALLRAREQGKIRYFGVSNYRLEHMKRSLAVSRIQSNQVKYNLFDREIESEVVPYCREQGIGVIVHSPLAKGLLTGRYNRDHRFAADDERSGFPRFQGEAFARYLAVAGSLREVARDKGLTLVELALAWTMRLPEVGCVLAGAKSAAQLEEALGAVGVRFHDAELRRLDELTGGTR